MGDIRTVTIGDYPPFRAELVSIERNAVKLTEGEHGWRDDGYVHWRAGDEMIVRFKVLPGEWPEREAQAEKAIRCVPRGTETEKT